MKLLFITHETSRTGAPLVLLHFLKWLQTNYPKIVFDVLALKGGDLEQEFKKACCTYYDYNKVIQQKKLTLLQKVFLKFGWFNKQDPKKELFVKLNKNNYHLVYANTIISVPFAYNLVSKNKNSKFVAHIHELNAIIKLVLPNFKNYINLIDKYIAPSNLVKDNLIANWGIPEGSIDIVYECATMDNKNDKLFNLKMDKVFTVGASGTAHWRKGHDIFLQLARFIKTNYPETDIRFVWVGRIPTEEQIILEEDLRKLGLNEIVLFTGELKDSSVYFNDFDVFVMTSREDPFPLVCIEVGMLGKPIICFKDATGTEEIIEKGGGYIVPYLNIEAMSKKIIYYFENEDIKKLHGEINKKEFSKFLPQEICPQLYKVLSNYI